MTESSVSKSGLWNGRRWIDNRSHPITVFHPEVAPHKGKGCLVGGFRGVIVREHRDGFRFKVKFDPLVGAALTQSALPTPKTAPEKDGVGGLG